MATAGLPAPAADPRRHDGQPRAAQGGLAAAGAGRPGRAAVQHPRYGQRARHAARARSTAASGERFDVAAAIEYAEFAELPAIWLLGWSFGTDLALRYGCDPAVVGAILLSPPLRAATEDDLAALGRSRASR